jgi:hypothetical protein
MIKNKKFSFRIVSVEKLENIIISYEQLEKFIEILYIYMNHLSGLKGKDTLSNIRLKLEVDKSKELINYLGEVLRLKCDLSNLRVSYNQVVLLIQAFILHQEHLQEEKGSSDLEAIEKNCELEALKEILTYLENSINYNYEVACIECEKKRKRKKNDMMGLGESGIVQAARIKMV